MAIIQATRGDFGSWQKTYKKVYSEIVGGFTDIIAIPGGAQGYDFQYKITNTGSGTIKMQKSSGSIPDIIAGTALWTDVGSAVAANAIGDQTGQFIPTAVRFVIAGSPNAADIITVECTFK